MEVRFWTISYHGPHGYVKQTIKQTVISCDFGTEVGVPILVSGYEALSHVLHKLWTPFVVTNNMTRCHVKIVDSYAI
jgi:hypothetical protein